MKIIIISFLTLFYCVNAYSQVEIEFPQEATDIAPLLIGEKVPNLVLENIHGELVKVNAVLAEKPTVMIFYRGGWCPFCNKQLSELQTIEKEILALGYQIVAISPDSRTHMEESLDKHDLKYRLLSDANMELSQKVGIAYAVKEGAKERLKMASGGKNPGLLPVPTVLVLNQDSEILFEYINPDYKMRMPSNLLISVLKSLK